jgi:hypothetical protein
MLESPLDGLWGAEDYRDGAHGLPRRGQKLYPGEPEFLLRRGRQVYRDGAVSSTETGSKVY